VNYRRAISAGAAAIALVMLTHFDRAQETPPTANPGGTITNPLQVAVRGCLKRGLKAEEYFITDRNATTWKLTSDVVNLGDYVGQSVLITGKPESNGKQPSTNQRSGKPQIALRVLTVKTLSASCVP
jgi:hypothetical protein